jgi:two-component system sensor histidine kinase RegB
MELGAVAGYSRAEGGGKVPADKFCAAIADKCQLMQPWMTVRCRYAAGLSPIPEIFADASLEQALLVLLRSAPGTAQQVEMSIAWDETHLQIVLCERGRRSRSDAAIDPGIPLFARMALAPGAQLDLVMAKTTLDRFGGTVQDRSRDGYVCVELSLALLK